MLWTTSDDAMHVMPRIAARVQGPHLFLEWLSAQAHSEERREELVPPAWEDLRVELALVSLVLADRPNGHEVSSDTGVDDS